jgi:hypothetical protein
MLHGARVSVLVSVSLLRSSLALLHRGRPPLPRSAAFVPRAPKMSDAGKGGKQKSIASFFGGGDAATLKRAAASAAGDEAGPSSEANAGGAGGGAWREPGRDAHGERKRASASSRLALQRRPRTP